MPWTSVAPFPSPRAGVSRSFSSASCLVSFHYPQLSFSLWNPTTEERLGVADVMPEIRDGGRLVKPLGDNLELDHLL